jgi:putative AlgH/UPF0301 family transcriptional regulator
MFLRNVCPFAMLAIIVAFAATSASNARIRQVDVLSPVSPPGALSPTSPANTRSASHSSRQAKSEVSPTLVLPAQSKNPDDLAVGKLLVASRDLADPIFAKTVILLVHHDAGGVLGLILNRRSKVPLSHVLDKLEAAKDRSDPVFLGGPVEIPAVFALFRSKTKLEEAESIVNDVYFIDSKTIFEKVLSARPAPGSFHVYLGYAGWTNEQLQKEVQVGAWFIFPADTRTVFDADPNSLWTKMIRKTEQTLVRNAFPELSSPVQPH